MVRQLYKRIVESVTVFQECIIFMKANTNLTMVRQIFLYWSFVNLVIDLLWEDEEVNIIERVLNDLYYRKVGCCLFGLSLNHERSTGPIN